MNLYSKEGEIIKYVYRIIRMNMEERYRKQLGELTKAYACFNKNKLTLLCIRKDI